MPKSLKKSSYQSVLSDIEELCLNARKALGLMYWKVGQRIVKAEQEGEEKAPYGKQLIKHLSRDLTAKFGSGFSESHLEKMRRFYLENRISLPAEKLPLSHQIEALSIKDPKRRKMLLEKAMRKNLTRRQFRELLRKEKISLEPQLSNIPAPKEPAKLPVTRSRLYTYQVLEPTYIHPIEEYLTIDLGFNFLIQEEIGLKLKQGEIIESIKTNTEKSFLNANGRRLHADSRRLSVRKNLRVSALDSRESALNIYSFKRSDATKKELYTYKALVERVVDADTIYLNIDLGFNSWYREKVRLRGIDCPEIDTKEGQEVKRFVEAKLKEVEFIVVKTYKEDKYERYLADIFYQAKQENLEIVLEEGSFLNQELLDKGLASIVQA